MTHSLNSLQNSFISYSLLSLPGQYKHQTLSLYLHSSHISLDDTSFHSTTHLSNHSLSKRATPSLTLPPTKPDTQPTTSPNITSPLPFILVLLRAHTSNLYLKIILLISPFFTSFVLHPHTLKTPIFRDWIGFTLPSPL